MKIEFVCHSSVVLRRDPIHLISDPWLSGTAFDDGWALLAEPVFTPADFASITHIWFSHEHPDHFSPRTLAAIPAEIRKNITVLFHASDDGKIVDHCGKLGFSAVTELVPGEWVNLAPGYDVLCDTWEGSDDSWLLVKTPEGSVLNLNDCQANEVAQLEALRDRVGQIDVLLSQFSISAWDGNAEDLTRRQGGARSMLARAVLQANELAPRYVIPFASFVWFCHEENDYMNSAMVTVGEVATLLRQQARVEPVVLYPGDAWELGTPMDSSAAIGRYAEDLLGLVDRPRVAAVRVEEAELFATATRFTARLRQGQSPLRVRMSAAKLNAAHQLRSNAKTPWLGRVKAVLAMALLRIRPARIWLTDHDSALEYCIVKSLQSSGRPRESCDIELSSGSLLFAFKFLWGGETLQINGRFRESYPDGRRLLFDYLWRAAGSNREQGALARPI